MVDTDDTRRTTDDGRQTMPRVWHKLPTGERKICLVSDKRILKILSFYSDPKLRFRPSDSDYNFFFYMLQNHSSITLFTLCVDECLINIHTKFYLPTVF